MYTKNVDERTILYNTISNTVMPALQRAIANASRTAVYEIEGFHPDITYGENLELAADEITSVLCDYFAGLSYRSENALFDEVTSENLNEWLSSHLIPEATS